MRRTLMKISVWRKKLLLLPSRDMTWHQDSYFTSFFFTIEEGHWWERRRPRWISWTYLDTGPCVFSSGGNQLSFEDILPSHNLWFINAVSRFVLACTGSSLQFLCVSSFFFATGQTRLMKWGGAALNPSNKFKSADAVGWDRLWYIAVIFRVVES